MKKDKYKVTALQKREERIGYLFLLPSFIGFVIFMLVPVVWGLALSLFNYDGFNTPKFVGFMNFWNLFHDEYFSICLKNNMFYMVFSVSLTLFFGLILAVLLNQPLRGRGIFKTVLFFPQLTSSIAVGMVFAILFTSRGPINGALRALGNANPPKWLTDPNYVMITITITAIIKNTGYYMILFLAGLQGISEDLYEAASLDGANAFQKFRFVTWPLITPTVFLSTILCVINSFKVFDLVAQMTDGGPANSSNVLVYRIYLEAFKFSKFGYASAYAVILFLIVLVFTLIQFRGQKKWVNY